MQALEEGADPNWLNPKDEMASLPLHYAAGQGYTDVVSLLVDAKADPNARNTLKYTPLHNAARKGFGAVAQVLILNGADVSAERNDRKTPLEALRHTALC